MRLGEYVQQQGHGAIARISRASGISYTTVCQAALGNVVIKRYEVAKAISDATGGEVTVDELCDPAAGVGPEAA